MSDEPLGKSAPSPADQKVAGLDTLRFVCALWVFLGHGAAPPLIARLDQQAPWGRLIAEIYAMMFSGPAAVIVFFIISGFCIHYPHRRAGIRSLGEYFIRRYVRILLPLGMAIAIIAGVNFGENPVNAIPIWSLVAELIYYTIYPLLLRLNRRLNWWVLFGLAFAASYVLVFQAGLRTVLYPSFGHLGNAVLGLPCWLLGVIAAQNYDAVRRKRVSTVQIWGLRLGMVALGTMTHLLAYREIIGQPFTLNLFAIPAWFWVTREISYFSERKAVRLLEWGGSWSYSLYLLHMFLLDNLSLLPFADYWGSVAWFTKITLALLLSYLFYRGVEQPAHNIARGLCRRRRSQ